jgi:AraC-like DNA-binding protein
MDTLFDIHRRPPSPRLAGIVLALTGYRETAALPMLQREAAPLAIPLIISFGTPFAIALGREATPADAQGSFASGLHPGMVDIRSDGRAACVQVDFTPLGAARLFGGTMRAITGCMVPLDALFGRAVVTLRDRIAEAQDWDTRFDLVEDFCAARLGAEPAPEIAFGWRRLAAGATRVEALAAELGWSRQLLHQRMRETLGLGPKPIARMLRFHRACALARRGGAGWAGIAAEAGYADQAHLVRDFRQLAGETPTAWARRAATRDARLREDAAV